MMRSIIGRPHLTLYKFYGLPDLPKIQITVDRICKEYQAKSLSRIIVRDSYIDSVGAFRLLV